MNRDARGLALSTDSTQAVVLFDLAVEHYLKYHADTMSLVNGALATDPGFVMAHCLKGYLMLASAAHRSAIATSLAAVQANTALLTAREQRHVAAFAACEALRIWRELLDADPTDLLAVRISDTTHFRFGQPSRLEPVMDLDHWRGHVFGCDDHPQSVSVQCVR